MPFSGPPLKNHKNNRTQQKRYMVAEPSALKMAPEILRTTAPDFIMVAEPSGPSLKPQKIKNWENQESDLH